MNHALWNQKFSSYEVPSSIFRSYTRHLMRARVSLEELWPQVFRQNSWRFSGGTTWLVPDTQIFLDKYLPTSSNLRSMTLVTWTCPVNRQAPPRCLSDKKRTPWSCVPGAVPDQILQALGVQEVLTHQPNPIGYWLNPLIMANGTAAPVPLTLPGRAAPTSPIRAAGPGSSLFCHSSAMIVKMTANCIPRRTSNKHLYLAGAALNSADNEYYSPLRRSHHILQAFNFSWSLTRLSD